jgi:hypothetical protein
MGGVDSRACLVYAVARSISRGAAPFGVIQDFSAWVGTSKASTTEDTKVHKGSRNDVELEALFSRGDGGFCSAWTGETPVLHRCLVPSLLIECLEKAATLSG